jgi:F-type H+-transporting ATPase subunit a
VYSLEQDKAISAPQQSAQTPPKAKKSKKKLLFILIGLAAVVLLNLVAKWISPSSEGMEIAVDPGVVFTLGGWKITDTMVISSSVVLLLLVVAALLRIFAVPKFKDQPKGLQTVLEMAVQGVGSMSCDQLGQSIGSQLTPYMCTVGLYIIAGGLVELFGVRAPASDINVTAALSLITFFLINFYAYKVKGFRRRMDHYTKPIFLLAPITLLTDIAVPISMACRLYGNMLSGLIVMDLIYQVLPIAIPAVLSVYFTLFHAALQAYIFLTLTVSFIHENIE